MLKFLNVLYLSASLFMIVHGNVNFPDFQLDIVGIIRKYGYPVEIHEITTEDGYMLTMFRIPHGRYGSGTNRKPILLMHGLYGQSENYIVAGMNNASLAYFLADNEFDVWLGNTRGNQHGRRHKTLDPNGKQFWDFSYHEIAVYDLPAKVDYILQKTKERKIFYVGHSQGGTIFYVMTSAKPEYQHKIAVATLLAPAGYMSHFSNPLLLPLARMHRQLFEIADSFQLYELPPKVIPMHPILDIFCILSRDYCIKIYHKFNGGDSGEFNKEMLPLMIKFIPSVSVKQVLHFAQDVSSGNFGKFDFGFQQNLKKYKVMKRPVYDLRNITVPVAIFYSRADTLVYRRDVEETCKVLSNCVRKFLMPNPKWTHFDFLFAINGRKLLHEPVLNFLKKFDEI